ncbi:MAG: hypothetical protein ACLFQX_00150 [Candidatus Kapaibacterium sp.]
MADEKTEEKQEPVKPEKKAKKVSLGGGLSLPVIIGAVVGLLVLIAATVIISIFVASKFMLPEQSEEAAKGGEHTEKTEDETTAITEEDLAMAEEEDFQKGLVGVQYVKTGRITTNPKGASQFIVLNLGLEFRLKNKDNDWVEEPIDPEDPMVMHMLSKVKGIVNQVLGTMTVQELHDKRSEMPLILKEKLKETFVQYRMFLREVVIEEYIIQ